MRKLLHAIIYLIMLLPCFAFATTHYYAFVDAGSSGSRVYLYSAPNFHLIASKKIEPGLSSAQNIGAYIMQLIAFTKTKLPPNATENNITFSLMATAGMRLLSPQEQQTIYQKVRETVQKHSHFHIGKIETIPGKWEAAYGWIAANHQNNTLKPNETIGVLDMGGASTEIAFALPDNTSSKLAIPLYLAPYHFHIVVMSYLGLGQNQIRNQYTNNPHCFPKGYPLPNGDKAIGNYDACVKDIGKLIKKVHRVSKEEFNIPKDMKFMAISIYHDVLHSQIFTNHAGFTPENLTQKGNALCAQDWETLQNKYGSDPNLYKYCFNLAYFDTLLTNGYNFKKDKYFDTSRDVDWVLGAVIYQAYHPS